MPPASHASPYQDVFLTASDLLCAAGDGPSSWAACHSGTTALRTDPQGLWQGVIRELCGKAHMEGLATTLRLAHGIWHEAAAAEEEKDPPWIALALSKGLTGCWFADPRRGLPPALWPGGSDADLARALGLRCFQGHAAISACSTGLGSLLGAADALAAGRCRRALVAALDRSLQPLFRGGFANLGVLCRSAPSAFSGAGTGFAIGEGLAAVTLSSDRAPVQGWRIVAGCRLADASHPTRCCDQEVLRSMLAGLWAHCPEPEAIVAHATGTVEGDAYELAGLDGGPWRDVPRHAWKPVIGHCLGASGLVELAIACRSPWRSFWKLSLGFGGHLAAVALRRIGPA